MRAQFASKGWGLIQTEDSEGITSFTGPLHLALSKTRNDRRRMALATGIGPYVKLTICDDGENRKESGRHAIRLVKVKPEIHFILSCH